MSDGRTSPRFSLVAASAIILMLVVSTSDVRAASSRCPSTKPSKARFRTVAWVNTTCRTDADGLVGRQELYVQRGHRAPVVISQLSVGPVPDPAEACRYFGLNRNGNISVLAGAYEQIAVSPNGTHVFFELNDAFSVLEHDRVTDDDRGLYLARTDGSDLIKLGPATAVPVFRVLPDGTFDSGSMRTKFSPDGRYVVYSDLGPTSDGRVDAQLWSHRLIDGKRTQLTHLARGRGDVPLWYSFDFANDTTIAFFTFDYNFREPGTRPSRQEFYSVSVNGEGLRKLSPIVGPNGQIIEQFALTGHRPAARGLFVEGTPENPMAGIDKPRELFVAFGKNVLQLTNFNRVDMNLPPVVSRDGDRVFFMASADPFGCNPTSNCQIFSIDTLGGHLRQLTQFAEVDHSEHGCFTASTPGCLVRMVAQDRIAGTLILDSSCDPLGTNPMGDQLFVLRPDGSGLRQITNARGVVTDTPEVVEVELPGPFAYQ